MYQTVNAHGFFFIKNRVQVRAEKMSASSSKQDYSQALVNLLQELISNEPKQIISQSQAGLEYPFFRMRWQGIHTSRP